MNNINPYNKLFDEFVKATDETKTSCDKVKKIKGKISSVSQKTHEMDKFRTPVIIKQKGGH